MGFTRYWIRPREFDPLEFTGFARDCEELCLDYRDLLCDARFGPDEVRFDGNPGCEPFVIERISLGRERDGRISDFCKTQGLPYDEAVSKCLLVLRNRFPVVEIPMAS
jgi:hypothetical protein